MRLHLCVLPAVDMLLSLVFSLNARAVCVSIADVLCSEGLERHIYQAGLCLTQDAAVVKLPEKLRPFGSRPWVRNVGGHRGVARVRKTLVSGLCAGHTWPLAPTTPSEEAITSVYTRIQHANPTVPERPPPGRTVHEPTPPMLFPSDRDRLPPKRLFPCTFYYRILRPYSILLFFPPTPTL